MSNTHHNFLTSNSYGTLRDLMKYAFEQELTHLWIVPGATQDRTMEDASREQSYCANEYDIRIFPNKATGMISSLVGRRLYPRTQNVSVIWLSQTTWPYESYDQFTLLIEQVEDALGIPMKASPTSVGLRYLEKIDAKYYKRYFADPEVNKDVMKEVFRNAAKPLIWCRMPTKEELTPRPELYLMAVDKRAAYPRAAQDNVGIGKPVSYTGEFNHRLPGAWDVEISGLEKIDSRLPSPLWDGWQSGMLVTPVVKMLKALGCTVKVREALVWEKAAPVFNRWANDLWNIRQEIPGLKAVMNNTLGFTINGDDMSDEKYRPDWHAQIVGGLRALMVYNSVKVAGESTMYPIGCYIDALYYLTPYRNHIPGLILNPASLGGYAMKWCLPVTEEVRQIITSRTEQQHFNMMLNKLNTMAGGHE